MVSWYNMAARTVAGAVLCAIFFLLMSLISISGDRSLRRNGEAVVGVVRTIETPRGLSESWFNSVLYVEYYADNQPLRARLREFRSGMYIDMEITLFYDAENPRNVTTGRFSPFQSIALIIGLGSLALSVGMICLIGYDFRQYRTDFLGRYISD